MELSPYVEALRRDLTATAATANEETRRVAELLGTALDPSVRLVVMDVLAQAAAEITMALPHDTVEIRLRGREPEFVVTHAETVATEPDEPVSVESDSNTVRITLRLPEPMKNAIEDAAGRAATSVNSWLVRAARQALDTPSRRPGRTSVSGYAQA
ncbi:MAG: hypothetical protein HY241_11420 [Actinobacteria bacterium]|nr:hypothetical protein [Actinomycetota bacterium]